MARDQLAGTVEQLKEAQGARERFFGNISHEIRTPLSLIMLAAGDIQSRAGSLLDARSSQSLTPHIDSPFGSAKPVVGTSRLYNPEPGLSITPQ